jgi:uncharacterized protein
MCRDVVTEVVYVLDFNQNAQLDFLRGISRGSLRIEDISLEEIGAISNLMEKYRDLPMDFADATLVYICERSNISSVATVDRDFDVYRIKGNKHLVNVFSGKQKP